MEVGNKNAGLAHILNHAKELESRGIKMNDIPSFTMELMKRGEIVSGTRSQNGQEGILLNFNERLYIISIGGNGFIVGLYPVREGGRYEATGYEAGYNRALVLGIR